MKLSEQLKHSSSLLDATSALSNWRAMCLLGATFLLATLVMMACMQSGSGFLAFVGGLLSLLVLFYGANAVGITLMDAAAGSPRSMIDAVMASLYSSHRLIGLLLVAMLFMLVLLLIVAVALFLCKIPALGTLLTIVVIPVAALIVGVSVFTINFVLYPMAAAAVWSGLTLKEAISHLVAIARQKLLSVVIQEVLLMFLVGFISLVIGMVVFNGLLIVMGMGSSIVNPEGMGGMFRLAMMMSGRHSYGGEEYESGGDFGGGQMVAMGIGAGLLVAIGLIVPGLIAIQGYCQIFLTSLTGLDLAGAKAMLDKSSEAVRRKHEEMRQKSEAQRQARQQALEAKAAAEETVRLAALAEEKAKAEEAARVAEMEAAAKAVAEAEAKAAAEREAAAQEAARLAALAEEQAKAEEAARVAEMEAATKAAAEAEAKATAEREAAAKEEARLAALAEEQAKAEEAARVAEMEAAAKAAAEVEVKATAEREAAAKAASTECPACHTPLASPDDNFCGECGHRLK